MIQRTRVTKPIHKEIVTNPKPNKKVKLLNEFVGGSKLTNKLVNENNIVINMPVPVVKKKRKKKPKISDEAKKNYQQTLSEFRNGNFIEPLDLPDISTIKTSDDLNNFTNVLRLTMGKPLIPIKGKPNLSIMNGEAKPLAPPPSRGSSSMDMPPPAIQPSSYTGTIGNAFTNIVPTNATQTQLSPPPAAAPSTPALPAPQRLTPEQRAIDDVITKLKPTNWVDSMTYAFLLPLNDIYVKAMARSLLSLDIDEETAKQTITTRLKELYPDLNQKDMDDKINNYIRVFRLYRKVKEGSKTNLITGLLDKIKSVVDKDLIGADILDEWIKAQKYYIVNDDYYDIVFQQSGINKIVVDYITKSYPTYNTEKMDKILKMFYYTYVEIRKLNYEYDETQKSLTGTNEEKLKLKIDMIDNLSETEVTTDVGKLLENTIEDLKILVQETPQKIKQVENINENPELFDTTYYPAPDNVYKEVNGHPFVTELKQIIRLVNPKVSPNNKSKAELIKLFKTEYDTLKNPVPQPPQEPLKEPTKLYQFIRDYYKDGVFQDKKNMPPTKQTIFDYAQEFIQSKNNEETNKKWIDFKRQFDVNQSKVLRPTLANQFYSDFIKFYETPTEATGTTGTTGTPGTTEPTAPEAGAGEPICVISATRTGLKVCYPASIYTDYLNQLITNNKIIELDLIYKKATSITPSPTLDNEIKIQEIIASSYRPDKANVIDNDFYVWLREQIPPNPPIKPSVSETSDSNLLPKYYEYLNDLSTKNELLALKDEYIKATDDDFIFVNAPDSIKIQKIKDSNYIPTNKKNPEFFDWLSKNPNPPPTPTPTPTPNTDDSTNLDSTDQNPDLSTNPNKKVISEEDKAILERYKNDYSIDNTEELQNLYMKYYGTFYNPRFGRDYPPSMAWKNIQSDLIFSLLHNGKEDISFYNDYQNEITNADFTIQDNEALIDKYYKAFLIFVRDNNISIGEIDNIDTPQEKLDILIQYMFFYQYSTTKTEPTEKVVSPLLLKYYKYLNFLSTNSDDVAIRAEYETATHDRFDYVGRPNSFLIEKIKKSNYIPTIEESPLFFTWLETNNGAEDTFTEEQTPKSQTNENQVNLAYKITNVSYDDEDKPRRIDQLMLLNNYTSRNVSVYQDGTTIYFCSTGSRAELSSQAAQDWLQSNIAILMGTESKNLSSRFVEERKVLDELVTTLQPTIIIFCGHSLGGRLSNELFTYSIESKRNVYQPFSITFNAGSVIHTSFTDKYNNEYLQHRVLQFHANYDPLSATNTIGTVVNVPFTGSYPHSMTNFENVDYSLYKNFVSEGLTFTETINPSYVVPEPIVAPKLEKETKLMELIRKMYELEPDKRNNNKTEQYIKADTYYDENREYFKTIDIKPFFRKNTINQSEFIFYMNVFSNFKIKPTVIDASQAELRPRPVVEVDPTSNDDKNLKLMNYFNELWEMNRDDDFDTTETFRKTLAYYERNKAYFTPLDRNAEKQPMIFNYLVHHETIRPIENFNRYPFFMSLFDRFSGDRRSIEPETNEKEQKLLNLLGQLFELDVNERYNQQTEQYINAAIYFNDNKEYFNSIDKETFIEKNTTPGEQFNFYMQMIMDFNRRPRPTITEPIFKEDKPGTIYINSTF